MIDCTKTENYFTEKLRMTKRTEYGLCGIKCDKCPLSSEKNNTPKFMSCVCFEMIYPEQAIKIVQEWSNTHQQRTCLTELLQIAPTTPLADDGIPDGNSICPYHLGLMSIDDCRKDYDCVKCWNHTVEDGEEQ